MALSSRLAVSGQISGIIRLDIRYYPARYPVLFGRISGISYMAGYPVRQLAGYPAGYPNPALKNCRISGYPVLVQSAGYPVSGYPAKSLSGTSLIKRILQPLDCGQIQCPSKGPRRIATIVDAEPNRYGTFQQQIHIQLSTPYKFMQYFTARHVVQNLQLTWLSIKNSTRA